MTQKEILQALKQMTNAERLIIAEAILRLIRENLQLESPTPAQLEQELSLFHHSRQGKIRTSSLKAKQDNGCTP